jgi:C-terminal processing protease CtpA/Prc
MAMNSRKPTRASLGAAQLGKPLAARVATRRRATKRQAPARLDTSERLSIIDTFRLVLEGAYCHLPQKRAAYAFDPVQALQLLALRAPELSDAEFHLQLSSIITSLRDAHTRYSGPRSMQNSVAVLPFLVEQFGPYNWPTFIVSKVNKSRLIKDAQFKPGVVLEHWSGIPIARAVDLYADRETGGRPDARRARALESLTFRDLEYGPPPDESWVDVGYRTAGGARREIRVPWRVVHPFAGPNAHRSGSRAARYIGANPSAEWIRRAKKLLFSGTLWKAEATGQPVASKKGAIATTMQDVLAARVVRVRGIGNVGYLRIWSFDVGDDDAFLDEVARLLVELPPEHLIIDLRGNPGGLIWAAELILQLLTPRRIVPTRFSLLATEFTRAMARSPFNRLELEAWSPSLEVALRTGDAYSQPLPLTDPEWFNAIEQKFFGRAVCVVDPNTYSSGDLFAAGFFDNGIGPVVCVGEASGAGGANVWTSIDLREALADTPYALDALPDGVKYTLAIRRAVRSGPADGVPLEDLGVPGIPYAMTRDDLEKDNVDLIAFCAHLLADAD